MGMFPALQSGFVAMRSDGLVRPNERNPDVLARIMRRGGRLVDTRYFYSPLVTELYERYSVTPSLLAKMDFREEILRAAFLTIQARSFKKWLDVQKDSPTIGDQHRIFLRETLSYISYGDPRITNNLTWLSLLSYESHSSRVKLDIDEYFPEWGANNEGRLPTKTKDIIGLWVSKENGFLDLLTFLYVVFGSRFGQFGVGDLRWEIPS